jgi:hypothetical protein
MNTLKVMKLAPMLVMLATLACATYAVQPDVAGPMPPAAAGKPAEAAGKTPQPQAPSAREARAAEAALAVRDPFRVASVPGLAQASP